MLAEISRRHRASVAAACVLCCVVAAGLVAVTLVVVGSRERGAAFRYDATTGPYKARAQLSLRRPLDIGICRCAPVKDVRLRLPEGFETVASLYDHGGPGRRPGIVFVHGNTWLGRNLSTYRLLASVLAENGFIVLTFDLLGSGESDDPYGRGPEAVAAASGFGAVTAAIDYLIKNTLVEPDRIAIFGHSGGVEPAIAIGFARPEIAGIVVMVAPPPVRGETPGTEESKTPGTEAYKKQRGEYFSQRFVETYRFIYGRELPDWYSWKLTKMEDVTAKFQEADNVLKKPGHKPILLLLGEQDQPSGHAFVLNDFELWAEPKDIVRLRRANHYLNAGQSLGFVFYDRPVAQQVREDLVPWLRRVTAR
jgi:pimeloyl-ACP methyl ester carboxylesterase